MQGLRETVAIYIQLNHNKSLALNMSEILRLWDGEPSISHPCVSWVIICSGRVTIVRFMETARPLVLGSRDHVL